MNGHSKQKDRRKQRGHSQTPVQIPSLSDAPPQAIHQQTPMEQQPQWLSANAAVTPNAPAYPQPSSIGANQTYFGAYNPGPQMLNSSSTTTTTTTTTSNQGGQQVPNDVVDHLQILQIQQPPQQSFQTVTTGVEVPEVHQLPLSQAPINPGPVPQPSQAPPITPNQNAKYPVTIAQRTVAFSQWQSANSSKPKRTIDRTKEEYICGKKDKEIYEMLMKEQQAQQSRIDIELRQSVKDLERKQQKGARDQKRHERQKERQAAEQETYLTQQNFQMSQTTQDIDRQQQKAVREQKRQERQQDRAAREQQRWQQEQTQWQQQLQWPQQSMQQNIMGGMGGFGGFGGTMSTNAPNITTTEIVNVTTQIGVGAESGENRRQAIAQGATAVQQLNTRIQTSLMQTGICPMGWGWIPTADASGYMCCGGNHFIPDSEIDKMLSNNSYIPQNMAINYPGLLPNGMMTPDVSQCVLKKPPDQVSRMLPCWIAYEAAKAEIDYASGRMGGGLYGGMYNGF